MISIVIFANSAFHILSLIMLFSIYNYGIVARQENYLETRIGEEYRL